MPPERVRRTGGWTGCTNIELANAEFNECEFNDELPFLARDEPRKREGGTSNNDRGPELYMLLLLTSFTAAPCERLQPLNFNASDIRSATADGHLVARDLGDCAPKGFFPRREPSPPSLPPSPLPPPTLPPGCPRVCLHNGTHGLLVGAAGHRRLRGPPAIHDPACPAECRGYLPARVVAAPPPPPPPPVPGPKRCDDCSTAQQGCDVGCPRVLASDRPDQVQEREAALVARGATRRVPALVRLSDVRQHPTEAAPAPAWVSVRKVPVRGGNSKQPFPMPSLGGKHQRLGLGGMGHGVGVKGWASVGALSPV